MRYLLSALAIATLISCSQNTQNPSPAAEIAPETTDTRVIYGDDNRQDLYEILDQRLLAVADSTVALVNSSNIASGSHTSRLIGDQFGLSHSLCSTEKFREQITAAFCSGSLVAPDTIITAGHCITNNNDCAQTRFVFGYNVKASGARHDEISNSDIYSCRQIVHTQHPDFGADFAVIKLDRAVTGHLPLHIRRSGVASVGTELVVMGYPVGLPLKIAGGASVRSVNSEYFVANLDTYGGNSGSAVFNSQSLEVEGILVRGEGDFVISSQGCTVSKRCTNGTCRGEDVTRIDQVLPYLNQNTPVPQPTPQPTPRPSPTPSPTPTQSFSSSASVFIPDNIAKGAVSDIQVSAVPAGRNVQISVDIVHSYVGDLNISLVSPEGKKIVLWNRSGGSQKNLKGTFGVDLKSVDNLSSLSNVAKVGIWRIQVSDLAAVDSGNLRGWSVSFKK